MWSGNTDLRIGTAGVSGADAGAGSAMPAAANERWTDWISSGSAAIVTWLLPTWAEMIFAVSLRTSVSDSPAMPNSSRRGTLPHAPAPFQLGCSAPLPSKTDQHVIIRDYRTLDFVRQRLGLAFPGDYPGLIASLNATGQDVSEKETDLEMVRRHVRQGAAHVVRQFQLVAKLRADGRPTEVAEQLLATFEESQRQHEAHLARLEG